MNTILRYAVACAMLIVSTQSIYAQSTWDKVYTILSTHCYGIGCHDPIAPGSFDVTGSKADLYAHLINKTPLNPYSKDSLGHVLVQPGYPERSFLLRKVAHSLDSTQRNDLVLDFPAEGADMPASGRPNLSAVQAEIIRQWILAGADSVTAYPTADSMMIEDFYNGGKGLAIMTEPSAPAAADGFQLHLGPIFINPNSESNFFLKHDLYLPGNVDVVGLELFTNVGTDQVVLRKYNTGTASSYDEGLIAATNANVYSGDKQYIMNWSEDRRYDLPNNTAFKWDDNTIADWDFTCKNTDNTGILAGEVFINVYTEPNGSNSQEMRSYELYIDPSTNMDTINGMASYTAGFPFADKTIWLISGNTNANGTNVSCTATGTGDSLVYDGTYDYENSTTGTFNSAHETVNEMPLGLYVSSSYDSLYFTAEYNSSGPVVFGVTSADEVAEGFVCYVDGMLSTGIADRQLPADVNLVCYPNPTNGSTTVAMNLEANHTVDVQVMNMLGQRVTTLQPETNLQAGKHQWTLNGLPESGVYFVRVTVDGATATQKLIVTK